MNMHSQRRIKSIGLTLFVIVLITLYVTSGARQTRSSEFYKKTSEALDRQAAKLAAESEQKSSGADIKERLKDAEKAAKDAANEKGGETGPIISGGDDSHIKVPPYGQAVLSDGVHGPSGHEIRVEDGVAKMGNTGETNAKATGKSGLQDETEDEHAVEVEMNSILKKSPIIIFSKTFCPFSRKAKRILLEKYAITPLPYVVELDQHPLGVQLQDSLAKKTHRQTVPNILINALSIGGGDDIELLDEKGTLVDTIKSMGGKRITEARIAETRRRRRR